MKNHLFLALSILTGLAVATPIAINSANKLSSRASSTISVSNAYQAQALPAASNALENESAPKILDVKKTLNLEDSNTVTLKGPVTDGSVSTTMKKLQEISRRVSKDTPIYLVLDTPGGDIMAGMELIDMAKALPQKVHTVTLFAASMGFQIAQGLNNRYIVRTGTLMSHRARMEGLGGQVKGELESRYKMVRRAVDYLDTIASQRMGLDLQTYEGKIYNELWVYGFDALNEKVADETVLVSCGESLNGTYSQIFDTFFGPVKVTFNKCPLIKTPESIEMGNIATGDQAKVKAAIDMAINNEDQFVREYIVTDRFSAMFKTK